MLQSVCLAAFYAGQHHGIGKHLLLGLLVVEMECTMLLGSAQKYIPFPQAMCSAWGVKTIDRSYAKRDAALW